MHALATALLVLAVVIVAVGHLWLVVAAFRTSLLWGLLYVFVPFAPIIFIITYWSDARRPLAVAFAGFPLIVVGVLILRLSPRAATSAPEVATSAPTVSEPATTPDPNPPAQDHEQLQSLAANGCRLSAPATWTVQADAGNADTKLVVADPTGELSVGIHHERAAGSKLTKRDIAQLVEQANRMPLKLEDSDWSSVDAHEAWREVRTGVLAGSRRTWIRYSYQMGSAVVQVIGVARGNRVRDERRLLETIMLSSHCE